MERVDIEIHQGRRAFGETQTLFGGAVFQRVGDFVDLGWYDTEVYPEAGSFAVVRAGGVYADLVGEVLKVSNGSREVFVYCAGTADVPQDLALYRRAFLHLAVLAREKLTCVVEVVA